MGDYMNFKYTLKDVSKFWRSNKLFYTPFHKFENPNSHRVQGGLRLGSGQITGALILFPDLEDKHLVWPAQLQFKFLACKKGKKKLLGTEEMKWELKDVEKFSEEIQWKHSITCSLEDLEKKNMIGQDDSVTFIWSVKLYFPQPQGFNLALSSRATSSHEKTKSGSLVKDQENKPEQEVDKEATEIIRLLKIEIEEKVVKGKTERKDGVIHIDVDDTFEKSHEEGYDEPQRDERGLNMKAEEIIKRLKIEMEVKVVRGNPAEKKVVPDADVDTTCTSENDAEGQGESQRGVGGPSEHSGNADFDTSSYLLEIFSRVPTKGASPGLAASEVEVINIDSKSPKKNPPQTESWFKKMWRSALIEGADVKELWPGYWFKRKWSST